MGLQRISKWVSAQSSAIVAFWAWCYHHRRYFKRSWGARDVFQ
jgi:hypothetical protein